MGRKFKITWTPRVCKLKWGTGEQGYELPLKMVERGARILSGAD